MWFTGLSCRRQAPVDMSLARGDHFFPRLNCRLWFIISSIIQLKPSLWLSRNDVTTVARDEFCTAQSNMQLGSHRLFLFLYNTEHSRW